MITKEELELHRKWVYNEDGGVRLIKIGADFAGAILGYANFAGAILRYAKFEGANLIGANFEGADLRDTNFEGADLRDTNFEGADLRGANFEGAVGNQREIYSLQLPKYKIVMTKDRIFIGCQAHSKADWLKFDRKQLEGMDGYKGLEWWDNYSKIVFELYDKIEEQIGEVV